MPSTIIGSKCDHIHVVHDNTHFAIDLKLLIRYNPQFGGYKLYYFPWAIERLIWIGFHKCSYKQSDSNQAICQIAKLPKEIVMCIIAFLKLPQKC